MGDCRVQVDPADCACREHQRLQSKFGTPARVSPRRSRAHAARLCRPDADRPRRRPLLEGVHLADRARQDAPDAGDDRVARDAARRRRELPRERRLERRARAGRGDPHPRRGARRAARLRRRDRGVRECAHRRRLDRRGRAAGARTLGRGLGARPSRRRQAGDRAARRGARARRGTAVHRPRPGRDPLPARRRPLPDLEHLDLGRAASARRLRWSSARSCRPTCFARTSSRGARAATGASATSRPRARTSSARSSSPSRCRTRTLSARRTSRPR